MRIMDELTLPDHAERVEKARAAAAWEIGDPEWADNLIAIYTGHDEPTNHAVEAWAEYREGDPFDPCEVIGG